VHATIQKPIEERIKHIQPGEKVFVVGSNNCAWKFYSGGEAGPIKGAIHRDKSIELRH